MTTSSNQIKDELSKVGGTLSFKELDKIKEKLNIKSGVRDKAENLGIKIFDNNKQTVPEFKYSKAEGMYPVEFAYQGNLNLLNAQGNIDTQIAKLNSDAAKYMARTNHSSAVLGSLISSFNF
jgi:hypothetical protein